SVRRSRATEAAWPADAAGDARIAAAAPQADDRTVRRGASGGEVDRRADRTAQPGTGESHRRVRGAEAGEEGPVGCEGRRWSAAASREAAEQRRIVCSGEHP